MEEKFQEAHDTFSRTVEIQPDYLEAWQGLAQACVNLKRPKEAINAAETALKIDANAFNFVLLGEILETSGDIANALKHYKEASLLSSDNPDLLFKIGCLHFQQDEFALLQDLSAGVGHGDRRNIARSQHQR